MAVGSNDVPKNKPEYKKPKKGTKTVSAMKPSDKKKKNG